MADISLPSFYGRIFKMSAEHHIPNEDNTFKDKSKVRGIEDAKRFREIFDKNKNPNQTFFEYSYVHMAGGGWGQLCSKPDCDECNQIRHLSQTYYAQGTLAGLKQAEEVANQFYTWLKGSHMLNYETVGHDKDCEYCKAMQVVIKEFEFFFNVKKDVEKAKEIARLF